MGGGPVKFYVFAIGASVLKQLGWDEESRLSILWGTGSDRGQVQIAPDSAGAWTPRIDKTGCGYLSTTALPPDCAFADFPDKPVEFSTHQAGAAPKPKFLQITVPHGFLARKAAA